MAIHATQLIAYRDSLAEAEKREMYADAPTQITGAIRPIPAQPKVTRPMLPVDTQGRPYIRLHNPYEDTQVLIEAAVAHFIYLTGTRPSVICLSAMRYFTYGIWEHYYYPPARGMDAIPLACEGTPEYDVLVRGEREFDGN